ncbi:SOS response-associated peptidase [Stenotrophomonas sp. 278]|uniref:SOS response-associated peptidase n=1 Tax=Stenotrophomonas sp. 278 TaxID=2479851 RepID=UPI000F676681|nr:SOS response-associated peptidase [Stenotrophomonas sp. 278]RRU12128.1 SOS response-associated peptidase [Stenotrophomonas sp. 278]
MRRFAQAFVDMDAFAPGLPDHLVLALASAVQRYNIGKGCQAAVLFATDGDDPSITDMHWGLVPRWSKEPSTPYTTVTARLAKAPASRLFTSAWQHRHCIVPMTGYYKWDRERKPPWPMFVQRQDGRALLAAGLWERWQDEAGQVLDSFTVLTDANRDIPAPLSQDGPLFVAPQVAMDWLNGTINTPAALKARARTDALEAHYVSKAVRDLKRDDYTLLEPTSPDEGHADGTVAWDGDGLDEDED